jgi:hypothetical protein
MKDQNIGKTDIDDKLHETFESNLHRAVRGTSLRLPNNRQISTHVTGAAGLLGTESKGVTVAPRRRLLRGGSTASFVLSSSVDGVSALSVTFCVVAILSGNRFGPSDPPFSFLSSTSSSSSSSPFHVLPPVPLASGL